MPIWACALLPVATETALIFPYRLQGLGLHIHSGLGMRGNRAIPNELPAGVSCAIRLEIVKRLTIGICMVAALFVSAVRLPALSCPVSSAPIGEACKQGSCPNKACCAEAEKNKSLPSLPIAKDDSASQQLMATVAPTSTICLIPVQEAERPSYLPAHRQPVSSTARRALLCTFLI